MDTSLRKVTNVLIVCSILLYTVGCLEANEETIAPTDLSVPPQATTTILSTSTNIPLPVLSPETAVEPTATELATVTPFPDTPDFSELELSNGPVLLSSVTECVLPCWHGLRVGISTVDDVKRVFDEVLGFNGKINLDHLVRQGFPYTIKETPGVSNITFNLEADPSSHKGLFSVSAVLDETQTLQGIMISQLPEGEYAIGSLQAIVVELGSPDYIDASIEVRGFEPIGVVSIKLIYFKGMSLLFTYEQLPTYPNDSSSFVHEPICLNTEPVFNTTYLVAPFDSIEIEQPTVTQFEWIQVGGTGDRWQSIEQQFDMSIAEFMSFIVGPDPCLDIDFSSVR